MLNIASLFLLWFINLLIITNCCVQDTDLSRNIPGKVKVSAPNLHAKQKHKWTIVDCLDSGPLSVHGSVTVEYIDWLIYYYYYYYYYYIFYPR